jgi:hypothetical protein
MPTKPRTITRSPKSGPIEPEATAATRALERRVKRLERELAALRDAHAHRLDLVRRAANRRLTAMMKEIATLRHHEARADALERLLASRSASASTEGIPDGEDPRLPG